MFWLIVVLVVMAIVLGIVYSMNKRGYWKRVLTQLEPAPVKENYREVTRIGGRRDRTGVISYALYGNWNKYYPQLSKNVQKIRDVLPGWQPRVYLSEEIPKHVAQEIVSNGGEVIVMPRLPGHGGALWRFLPGSENLNFVSLDADDDFVCLSDIHRWMESGKPFLLLNKYQFLLPMMAGMWGARAGTLPDIQERLERYREDWFGYDETFLRQEIWPTVEKGGWYRDYHVPMTALFIGGSLILVVAAVWAVNRYFKK